MGGRQQLTKPPAPSLRGKGSHAFPSPRRSLDPAPLGFAGLSSPPFGGATLSGESGKGRGQPLILQYPCPGRGFFSFVAALVV